MRRLSKRLCIGAAGLGLIAGGVVASTPAAQASAVNGFHLYVTEASFDAFVIYKGANCTGVSHILDNREAAQSTAWVSFKPYVASKHTVQVSVYNGSTGAYITSRFYSTSTCVKAYASNDYELETNIYIIP